MPLPLRGCETTTPIKCVRAIGDAKVNDCADEPARSSRKGTSYDRVDATDMRCMAAQSAADGWFFRYTVVTEFHRHFARVVSRSVQCSTERKTPAFALQDRVTSRDHRLGKRQLMDADV